MYLVSERGWDLQWVHMRHNRSMFCFGPGSSVDPRGGFFSPCRKSGLAIAKVGSVDLAVIRWYC